ncbi:ABC-type methionine transport system ATPase subunit [Neomicrococcus aestuarii]|uniref:ABC-type methionine transport system ATPase subunit n=1 Tax=Neomicrococcus aestuarii TaxID=556325 RepID=A0A7W8X0A6_9MICC|nr:ATP-binding cassette domain-containing protein [Neomicrococcus aestuarii]MBB5511519.1 ABC-type methionine transport system ATPase subunit [Neomicrococcus aestuarii]
MISLRQLTKVYGHGPDAVTVLENLDIEVASGEILAVVGPSGAGKSTLAQCISLLERPTSGSVIVNGEELSGLSEAKLRVARRRIGTVFQSASLLSRKTAAENVALPLEYLGVTKAETKARVDELLDRVGLSHRANHYPFELSGGQRQRVGIARALALRPSVLLSDEATSGLDPETTRSVVKLVRELRDDLNLAVVFITHEMDTVLQVADSAARLDHGRIVEQGRLVDLLTNHDSALGRALQPNLNPSAPLLGTRSWVVTYDSRTVPADWLQRVSADIGEPVALLAATIQSIDGVGTGNATVGVAASDDVAVELAFARYGLQATLLTSAEAASATNSAAGSSSTSATPDTKEAALWA